MTRVRPMTAADLSLGLRLSRQAGWNQTEVPWRRALELEPDGCFVAEWDGTPVGTTTTCLFGPVAWVAMVLVAEAVRGRGIGTALMRHALDFLDGRGVATVRLDATPLGRPVYERLGFVEQFQLARYAGTPTPGPDVAGVETAQPEQWDRLAARDREVTGTDRRRLLDTLFAEQPDDVRWVRDGDRVAGFLTWRPGALAAQVGPGIANARAGPSLLAD